MCNKNKIDYFVRKKEKYTFVSENKNKYVEIFKV